MKLHLNDHRENNHTVASSCNFFFIFPFPRLCRSSSPRRIRKVQNVIKLQVVIWTLKSRDFADLMQVEKIRAKNLDAFVLFRAKQFQLKREDKRQFDFGNNRTRSGARELKEEGDISHDSVRVLPIGAEILDSQNDSVNRDRMWIFMSKYRETQLILSILCQISSFFFSILTIVILNETRKMRLKIYEIDFFLFRE